MSVRLIAEPGTLVRVAYEAPPVPDNPEPAQGEKFLQLPTEGEVKDLLDHETTTPVTTLTLEGGFNIYLERAEHDWTAAEEYALAFNSFLHDPQYEFHEFLGVPKSQHPTLRIWLTRYTLQHVQGLHDQITVSPLAKQHLGPEGGKIVVPGTSIPLHGQKRRH